MPWKHARVRSQVSQMRLHRLQPKARSQAQPVVSAARGSPSLWAAPAPQPLHPAFITSLATVPCACSQEPSSRGIFLFFFFFQKNHPVIKFNLRTCRELLMRKCLAISPQPACRNVLLWLVFIGMDVSGVCNLGTLDVNSLESKGSYCRERCSWD